VANNRVIRSPDQPSTNNRDHNRVAGNSTKEIMEAHQDNLKEASNIRNQDLNKEADLAERTVQERIVVDQEANAQERIIPGREGNVQVKTVPGKEDQAKEGSAQVKIVPGKEDQAKEDSAQVKTVPGKEVNGQVTTVPVKEDNVQARTAQERIVLAGTTATMVTATSLETGAVVTAEEGTGTSTAMDHVLEIATRIGTMGEAATGAEEAAGEMMAIGIGKATGNVVLNLYRMDPFTNKSLGAGTTMATMGAGAAALFLKS
jgi:hypothetical protein